MARLVAGEVVSDGANWLGQTEMWVEPPVVTLTTTAETPPIRGWIGMIEHDDDLVNPTYDCRVFVIDFQADVAASGEPYLIMQQPQTRLDGTSSGVYEFTNLSIEMDGDLGLHCAWRRQNGDIGYAYIDPGYYNERTVEHIHEAYLPSSSYPNARNPQLSVYGDSAYIVYQEAGGAQHIKCTSHRIGALPGAWSYPATQLDTRGDYLRDQPYRRGGTPIWQEEYLQGGDQDCEIFDPIYFASFSQWVSTPGDNMPAYHPNVNSQWLHWWLGGELLVSLWNNALWTETTATGYDVRYAFYQVTPWYPSSTNYPTLLEPPAYLGIKGGEESQPYALRRYGTFRFNDYGLDYDPTELLYKISFLAPPYQYLARVIVSVPQDARIPGPETGTTAYTEEVSFDNTDVGSITFAPGMTDTLYALIPADAYAQDRMIRLSIKGIAGAPALLKDFTVYRFETEPAQSQGSSSIDETPLPTKIKLWTTQTSDAVTVYYSLSEPSRVAVKVFDCSGRCVSSDEVQGASGVNSLSLDKRGMSAGVYFIRVSTPWKLAACKAINLH